MSTIHPVTGAVAHGLKRVAVDGAYVSTLLTRLGEAGGWAWLSVTEIAGPGEDGPSGPWITWVYDLKTGGLRKLEGGTHANLTNHFGAASDGTWAASGAGAHAQARCNLWLAPKPGILRTVTRDGWVVVSPDDSGLGFTFEHRDHVTILIADGAFVAAQDGYLLYRRAGQLWLRHMQNLTERVVPDVLGNPATIAYHPEEMDVYGLIWRAGWTFVYRLSDPSVCWPVSTGDHYSPSLIATGAGFRLVSFRRAGAQPDDWQDTTVNLSAPPVPVSSLHVPLVVAPFAQPKFIGAWMVTSRQHGAHAAPGNCEVLADAADPSHQVVSRPVFATVDVLRKYTLHVPLLGVVCGAPEGIAEVREACETRRVGAVLYTDDVTFNEAYRVLATRGDYLAPQAYRLAHETAGQFAARLNAEIDRLESWGLPIVLVAGWFDRRASVVTAPLTLTQVEECLPVFADLLRRPSVVGMLAFAYARAGGIRDLDLDDALAAFAEASPGLPVAVAPTTPILPTTPTTHPVVVVPPVVPPVVVIHEEHDMPVAITLDPVKAVAVTEVAHPDEGMVGLQRGDGKYLQVDGGNLKVSWVERSGPTGWEGFRPSATSYTAVRDAGTLIFAKGASW